MPASSAACAQADGRERERRRHFLAEDGGLQAARRYVHQHALPQLDGFEVGAVGAQGFLVVGAAVGVIEKGARNPAAGDLAQVLDAGGGLHGDGSGSAWRPRVAQERPAAKREVQPHLSGDKGPK